MEDFHPLPQPSPHLQDLVGLSFPRLPGEMTETEEMKSEASPVGPLLLAVPRTCLEEQCAHGRGRAGSLSRCLWGGNKRLFTSQAPIFPPQVGPGWLSCPGLWRWRGTE